MPCDERERSCRERGYRFASFEEADARMTRTMARPHREPQIEDLVRIYRALNDAGARYILIGGFAVIVHGGARTTKDIDLMVDSSPENITRVKQGLRVLEDRAVEEVADTDVTSSEFGESSRRLVNEFPEPARPTQPLEGWRWPAVSTTPMPPRTP